MQEFHYLIRWLSMEDELRQLKNDFNALDKAVVAREEKKINVYIVHSIDEPQIIPPALVCGHKEVRPPDGKKVKHRPPRK